MDNGEQPTLVSTPPPAESTPQAKRRGRPPKNRDPDDENDAKRPRGRPRNSDKPSATWCADSVKHLFELRYDSNLRHKFEERDNRAKRTGYELLAATLSEKMGRKFDNTQVQQKLSQLNAVWAKLDPSEDESTRPAHFDVMLKYWGPHTMGKKELLASAAAAPSLDSAPPVVVPPVPYHDPIGLALASSLAMQPNASGNMKLRRLLSKQMESDEAAAVAAAGTTNGMAVPAAVVAPPTAASTRGADVDGFAAGFFALKDGLFAISAAIAHSSSSAAAAVAAPAKDDKIDALIAAVRKQTTAIEEQSKQLTKLVSLLSQRDL
ncbi:Aste57867_19779 [Aphanomyces stellatus]|uniref:Aste57867_19779 protein n=1 Tax=Aphanomyces stellatus TaxID=120398 RepID=A0A485LE21_9STRA|nr:hypothetical protein As57867_019714 [Aphanomyces stellatus]VFT96477.1 Aste57867_19779 [Aphanomyces stellatus]